MFEIILTATGDRAEADSAEAALLAADTLVRDHCDQQSSRSLKRCRETLIISENGTYAGILTACAQNGLVIRDGVGESVDRVEAVVGFLEQALELERRTR